MTEQSFARETAGAVRSAHVAHFFAPDWAQVAQRASGALERTARDLPVPQLLVTVPDAGCALELSRELRALPAAAGLRVVPVTGAARAARLLRDSPAHVVVGAPSALADLLAASALKVGAVHTAMLASADEYDAELEPLGAVMAELPRESARILTAAAATPVVERLLERHLHRARRMTAPPLAGPAGATAPATIHLRTVAWGAFAPALVELLDDLDAPSVAIVASDARGEHEARAALAALGYDADSVLARVARDVAADTALVVLAGLPSPGVLGTVLAAHPARVVALVTARQAAALRTLDGAIRVVPLDRTRALRGAVAHEDAVRARLRAALAMGLPAREMLALEPLLAEHDALEVAGAALRLYEEAAADVTRLAARDAKRDAERRDTAPPRDDRRPHGGPPNGPRGARGPRPRGQGRDDRTRSPRRER